MNAGNKWLVGSLSAALITGVTYFEGTKYVPYEDIVGVLTVCQGYTGKDIDRTHVYSKVECDAYLSKELQAHAKEVLRCVNVPLKQYQYDAFVMFTYNVGGRAFCSSSTVLKPLNQGNYQQACDGLLKWTYAGGKYVQGLMNRRVYERKMCMGELNG